MITILATFLFTFWFIHLAALPKRWKLPAKPFGCIVCLPVYVAAALYFSPEWISEAVAIIFAAPLVTWMLSNLLTNLKNKQNDYDNR